MSLKNKEIEKKIKVKKNIDVFKKINPIIKIKNDVHKKKSMVEALKDNEVLLWGLNQVDSLIIKQYEIDYKKPKSKKTNNKIEPKINIVQLKKTTDTEYNPEHKSKYNYLDLNFLNTEYDVVDNKISKFTDLGDEYDKMMNLQDELAELIEELEY